MLLSGLLMVFGLPHLLRRKH
ncbi:hypothetical protein [Acidovorax delafieldii]